MMMPTALAIGANGVYVAGYTASTDFPGTAGGAQPAGDGAMPLLPSSALTSQPSSSPPTWGEATAVMRPTALAIGANGVYVAGILIPPTSPAPQGAPSRQEMVTMPLLPSSALTSKPSSSPPTWGEATAMIMPIALAIGANGVYVAGYTSSTDFPGTAGGAQPTGDGRRLCCPPQP